MTSLLNVVRTCLVLGALLAATLAVAALFGFAFGALDLLNHAQIFLFPGTLLGLVILALALRGQARRVALIYSFVGLAASANVMVPELISGMQVRPAPPSSGTVTMMTHNLFGMNYEMAKVTAAIAAEDPDIIVLQEYFGEQATDLHPRLLADYPFFTRCRGGKRANLGLYSRIPFEQVQDGACPNNAYVTDRTGHILARFQPDGYGAFSVLTTHMDWPLPVERQRAQLVGLSAVVAEVEGPLIVAGDFNSTPWSYALRDFVSSNGLVRETVNLVTYPLRWFYFGAWQDTIPFLPLDHVMTRGGVVVHELHAGRRTASDHLPVVFTFSVQPSSPLPD
ncbi:endonuclease/exonuclease/phosphatase family protein [Devosia sp. J2-20]|uniref:endonuclease/exonuclease/phosphatase family protein n=1 Tax=Devosia sp. J2-20 TaxID=3026161 RepID=UPI00249A0742|nr:endonuclease/exonuclease/phosphatase family protein [Devosia sp. J2-20]WDQ98038.1 endonuclease/exonuclease/phosphatase family protein [Devosia sp. J2-20]